MPSSSLRQIVHNAVVAILVAVWSYSRTKSRSWDLLMKVQQAGGFPGSERSEAVWSAGEVFFILLAIRAGFYAYPRGCLIAPASGRSWRLSPTLVLQELVFGIFLFFKSMSRAEADAEVCCAALLAFRSASTFNPYSVTARKELGLTASPIYQDQLEEWAWHYKSLRRFQDSEAAETYWKSEQGKLELSQTFYQAQSPMLQAHTQEAPILVQVLVQANALRAKEREKYNLDLCRCILKKIEDTGHGSLFRIFVWPLMCWQFGRLIAVLLSPQRFALWVFAFGFIYFCAWLAWEFVIWKGSRNSLSNDQIETAARLFHNWRTEFWGLRSEDYFRPIGGKWNNTSPDFLVPTVLLNQVIVLWALLPVFNDLNWIYATLVFQGIFMATENPFPLLLFGDAITWIWSLLGGERRYGKLWQEEYSYDAAPSHTAYVALWQAGFMICAFAGTYPLNNSIYRWKMF